MAEKSTPLHFLKSVFSSTKLPSKQSWPVLVVDDDEQVHLLTKLVLANYNYHEKGLTLYHAYSARDAIEQLKLHPDIALILLDVVMETNDAGLQCAKRIRDELHNDTVQIVLRTGQPGDVPEQVVMQQYDINDYKCKTELTKERLFSTITSSLRAFEHVSKLKLLTEELKLLNHSLEDKVQARTQELETSNQGLQKALCEIERQQFKLVQVEKLASLGQLAAGVAHEINNPLAFLISNMEFLKSYIQKYHFAWNHLNTSSINSFDEYKKLLDAAEIQFQFNWMYEDANELITDACVGLHRIQAIVKDLSVFTAPETRQLQEVNIETVLLSVIEKQATYIPEDCKIETIFTQIPMVECMDCKLTMAFSNVLKNALESLPPENGQIVISTAFDNTSQRVSVTFTDNGKGIAESTLHRVFDPFYTTKPIGSATGLGLSIALSIVKSHFGDIHINSVENESTQVTIELPISYSHLSDEMPNRV